MDQVAANDTALLDALEAAYAELSTAGQIPAIFATDDEQSVGGRIRRALENHPKFGKGRQVFAGGHQLQLHPDNLSRVLGRALYDLGPKRTLVRLYEIFALKAVESRRCAELIGFRLAGAMSFSNGVKLLPLDEMRSSWHADQIKHMHTAPRPFLAPFLTDTAGMISITTIELTEDVHRYGADYSFFTDVALGITVASQTSPVVGAAWSEYEKGEYAYAELGWSHMPARYEGRTPSFSTIELAAEHLPLINGFLDLAGNVRGACTTAAARLNSSRRRVEAADSAIDLATAFEALLSTRDENTEIIYRLKLRSALLLGTTYDERLKVSDGIGALYKFRSKVVHGGIVKKASDEEARAVAWADSACRQLLEMVVRAGRLPDLKKLELTGNAEAAFE